MAGDAEKLNNKSDDSGARVYKLPEIRTRFSSSSSSFSNPSYSRSKSIPISSSTRPSFLDSATTHFQGTSHSSFRKRWRYLPWTAAVAATQRLTTTQNQIPIHRPAFQRRSLQVHVPQVLQRRQQEPEPRIRSNKDLESLARIIRGIPNIGGATCFVNSVTQNLLALDPLRQAILEQHRAANNNNNQGPLTQVLSHLFMQTCDQGPPVTKRIRPFYSSYSDSDSDSHISSPAPLRLEYVLGPGFLEGHGQGLGEGRQQDAEEFFTKLFSALQAENRPIAQIFEGRTDTDLRCTVCGRRRDCRQDSWGRLTLPITRLTLEACLRAKFPTQILEEYICEVCNSKGKTLKLDRISLTPDVLVLHMLRYTTVFNRSGFSMAKNDDHVVFPEILQVETSARGQHRYELSGIVVHIGSSPDSGHYIAYVRGGAGFHDQWYVADDSRIRPVSLQTVLHSDAYLLFYVKIT